MRWAMNVAYMGDKKNSYRALASKTEGKRPLAKTRHGWEDKIKVDLQ
jgi:hypothetical protein